MSDGITVTNTAETVVLEAHTGGSEIVLSGTIDALTVAATSAAETVVTVNQMGPRGLTGPEGPQGPAGLDGAASIPPVIQGGFF